MIKLFSKKKIRLKPVIYDTSKFKKGAPELTQQMFLLKALKITQDPKKLKEIMGVRKVADVYRTLDKLAMRKEYHKALSSAGISFDYITKGIKKIADTSEKDDTKLKALQTLLKSVGMEKYDIDPQSTEGTWEEVLLKKIEESGSVSEAKKLAAPSVYEVKVPELPESERLAQQEERETISSIYD